MSLTHSCYLILTCGVSKILLKRIKNGPSNRSWAHSHCCLAGVQASSKSMMENPMQEEAKGRALQTIKFRGTR